VSLPKNRGQLSFYDTPFVLSDFIREEEPYHVFRKEILPALRKAQSKLDALYCADNGREAIDPVLLAGVTLLQFMEKKADRGAAENVRLHLGWKYALNLAIDYQGFHATTLSVFRGRLVEGEEASVAFDGILEGLREAGLVKKRSKQRLDSTHVLGLISRMSTLELMRETLRLALEELAPREARSVPGWESLWERYVESTVDWRTQDKEKLLAKLQHAGEDAFRLLDWLDEQDDCVKEGDQAKLLRRVLHEQFEFDGEDLRPRKEKLTGTVCNPHDPEVQHASKDLDKKKTWQGYKAQVAETVGDDPEPKQKNHEPTDQFLTDLTTTEAIASDLDGMNRSTKAQDGRGQEPPPELYADAAYVSDDTLHDMKERGTQLLGPARPSPKHQKVIPSDQFAVSNAERKAVCPAGRTSTQCSHIHDHHKGTQYYRYEWGSQCDRCPLRSRCTTAKGGRRALVVGLHHDLLQARREEMKTEEFKTRMKRRNGVEGTVSELTRGYGMRRTRYRGLKKTALANYFIGAACNASRWIRRVIWEMTEAEKN